MINWGTVATGNTNLDGTGTVTVILDKSDKWRRIGSVLWESLGANIQTVGRLFLNDGGANSEVQHSSKILEIDLPLTTLDQDSRTEPGEMVLNYDLPPGFRLLATVGTTVAAGYQVTPLIEEKTWPAST